MLKDDIGKFIEEYNTQRNRKETNVLYLTSNCNFDCDYCFEKKNRERLKKQINASYEQINEYLDDIEWREQGYNSTVVLFGGEPLLMIDKMEYVINQMKERKKDGGWGWIVTTNRISFKKQKH